MNRLKVQRLESRRKTPDIYKVVGYLMPYRLCALTSAQLKLSSVRFMQQWVGWVYFKCLLVELLIEPKVHDCSFRLHTTLPFPTHLGPLDLYLVITP